MRARQVKIFVFVQTCSVFYTDGTTAVFIVSYHYRHTMKFLREKLACLSLVMLLLTSGSYGQHGKPRNILTNVLAQPDLKQDNRSFVDSLAGLK